MLCALKKFYYLGALYFPRGSQPPPLGPKIYIFGDSENLVYIHWRELLPQWLIIVEGSSLKRPLGLLKPHLNYKIHTVDSRSNGSAYNKNPSLTIFLFVPHAAFSFIII